MKRWTTVIAAALAVGCTGSVGGVPPGQTQGSAGAGGPGAAGTSGDPPGGPGTAGGGGSGVVLTGAAGNSGASSCTAGVAVTSQIARLTNEQYDRTVADLLGVTGLKAQNNVPPSTILATDQAGGLTDLAWSTYQSVADMIATQVMADATLKRNFITCTPTGDGKVCYQETVLKFGRKAFRRPLTTAEIASFQKIIDKGATLTATGTADEVAGTLLYMFLISPSFLMRSELEETPASAAGLFALSSYEVASRLSYMLWGSTPDDPLNAAADAGQLTTPAEILSQARRMIGSPKARGKVAGFHRVYMHMGTNSRWDNTNHDTTRFPAFTPSVVPALQLETEKFFEEVVFTKNGTFQDLLTSPVAYVNAQTARLYGLPATGFTTELKETMLDPIQRPGFLTRVGFLNAYSAYSRTSPILRGAFIMKDVLGRQIASPPPGAEAAPLPSGATLDTNRKQVSEQTRGGECMGCHHEFINPAGFVMESFDAVGAWQTAERDTGVAIDPVVDLIIDGARVRVNNVGELMAKIAASPMAQRRYAERWTSYAYEREGDPLDSCTVQELSTKIAAGGYTVRDLIVDLTQSTQFRTRALGVTQ